MSDIIGQLREAQAALSRVRAWLDGASFNERHGIRCDCHAEITEALDGPQ